ncbi:hypothetical protein ABZ635_22215 [Nocardiopsis sp. NPDC007018]|uniref:hypothetical protein n=1 Tax=Nocardiopsis sp. NPDC007018 TaxID=3155721 RepID=UPI0033CF640D
MTTIEDRYYMQPEPPDAEEMCRYENEDGAECGMEAAYHCEVLCRHHVDLVDTGDITWAGYRALADHFAA